MNMKKTLALILAACMSLSLVACGGGDKSNTPPAGGSNAGTSQSANQPSTGGSEAKTVGIAMPTQSLERWNRDGAYLDEQFKAAGYKTIVTYSDNKNEQQVNDIQNMLSQGVDLLIIAAIDGNGLNTVMNDAGAAGVPVIAYDRLIMNDNSSYYVSFDNYTVGKLQGEFVRDALDLDNAAGPFNMEFTAGDPADNNAPFFYNGAFDVLKPYIDSGKVIVPSGQTAFDAVATDQWQTDVALDRAQNVLASFYSDGTKLDAWLCSNDSTSMGVTQAVTQDYAGGNTVVITGQDGDVANLRNIKDGKQSMTVYKAVANEAVVTLDLAKAILDGKTADASLISASGWDFECAYDTESYETTPGHKCPSFLLVPDVVTADNMEEKLVTPGYYKVGADGYLEATNG
ncbi:MAG: sugar ABC transporter substrate-binding protein [Lawsonibacter sp.]|jgi:putative multiple sugar transport system substrate-binding protein|nr:sugar ABC transporter substrate-binding protein [Lawsonibacter sp.]